ncbi:unnamed protein product [Cochlearia groenlandica]
MFLPQLHVAHTLQSDIPLDEESLKWGEEVSDHKVDFLISLIFDGHNFTEDDWKVDGIVVRPPRPHIPVRPQISVQSAMQRQIPSSRKKTTAVRPRRKVAHNVQNDSGNEGSSSTSISNEDLSLLKGWGKSSVGRKRKNTATLGTLSDERGCPSETVPNAQQTASGGWGRYGPAFDIATSINREDENIPSQSGDAEDVTMDDVDTQKDVG